MKTLFELYRSGMNAVIEQGIVEPDHNFLILRAITQAEVAESGIILDQAQSMNDSRRAPAYEVVACGPTADPGLKGMHVMPMQSAVMPTMEGGRGAYVLCRDEYIAAHWDPAKIEMPEPEPLLEDGTEDPGPGAERLKALGLD